MSIQAISNPKLYQLDYLIQDKLEIILTNDTIHSKYPDYQNCGIFEDPLQLYKTKTLENAEIPRENTTETVRLLRQERSELVSVIKQLNEEKQELQRHNFELMEKLFVFENFNIEKFDHNFNQYLSRVIFLNYELCKKFLEMERENSEKMKESLIKKDDEVLGLKSKITLLEQKVIESRKMLKKTILETPALATQGSNEIANMGSVNNLDFNKQFSTQQDTLNDSSMRTYDKNRNNYPRVGLLSPNQIEAPMSARLQNVNFDKLSGFGTEDTSFDEIDSKLNRGGGRTTKHSNMKTQDTSPSISGKKDQPKSMTKIGGSKNTLTVPRMSQQFPTTQLTSPKGTVTKGGLTKSSSQKTLELQSKSKLKSDTNSPKKDENLSLSFLLDQNISVDSSINFPAGIMSGAATRELEGEYKRKGNLKEASNTSKTETSTISRGKVASTAMMSKTMSDPNKNKLKVPINTTPITVKKKSNEPK